MKDENLIGGKPLEARESIEHYKARTLLEECKKREKKQDLVTVRIDSLTVKLVTRERYEKKYKDKYGNKNQEITSR